MKTFMLALVGVVALAGGTARMQEPATAGHDHAAVAAQQTSGSTDTLDQLVAELNAARGNDRIDKLVAVVNALAAERHAMRGMMMNMKKDTK